MQQPAILLSVKDAVVRLDVESALADAGYHVITLDQHLHALHPLPDRQRWLMALVDPGHCWSRVTPLIRLMDGQDVPWLILGGDEDGEADHIGPAGDPDGRPAILRGVPRLRKPFAARDVLDEVRRLTAPGAAPGARTLHR